MLKLTGVGYEYHLAKKDIQVLNNVTHTFTTGSFTSIQGPSGSGKTTLLNVLGLLDTPTQGNYAIGEQDTRGLADAGKSKLRAQVFGFLFQNFRLIPTKSVLENIMLGLEIAGLESKDVQKERALDALARVGLTARASHVPAELSGGESQRVAFARAVAKNPDVLLADEPTGNLDQGNRDMILDLMDELHQEGKTIVMVTHDPVAAARADHVLTLSALQGA